MKTLTVYGRRWWDRINTYHVADILIDGVPVHTTEMDSGGGEMYLQTAWEWLIATNRLDPVPVRSPNGSVDPPWHYCREHGIALHTSVSDVSRKRDL